MAISEFRFNKRRRHPSYVFKKKNNQYHSILITHSLISKRKKNVKLSVNPNPKDKAASYLVPRIYKDDVNYYDRPKKQWYFSNNDKRKVKRIRRGKKV